MNFWMFSNTVKHLFLPQTILYLDLLSSIVLANGSIFCLFMNVVGGRKETVKTSHSFKSKERVINSETFVSYGYDGDKKRKVNKEDPQFMNSEQITTLSPGPAKNKFIEALKFIEFIEV